MIEIKFNRQQLTTWEKERYARVFKKIIARLFQFNKGIGLLKDVISTESKIIFK